MKKSRLWGAVCACLAAISINANADVITDTHLTLGNGAPLGQYVLTVCQDIPCDYTELWFDKVDKHGFYNILGDSYFGDYSTLTQTGEDVDEGSDYYLVPYGAEFTAAAIAAGQFSALNPTGVDVPFGTFYLGVNTGIGFSDPGYQPSRDVFGWAQFSNSSTGLQMISNAMAYGTNGIVVGTTETIVPIPAAVCLFGSGLIGLIGAAGRKVRA
jgi:hypothetical protein